MLFAARFHPGLADGTITCTFRAWKRPQVRVGGEYNVGPVRLLVTAVAVVRREALGDGDARSAGFEDREHLLAELDRHLDDDRAIHRIDFTRTGAAVDRLAPLRESADLAPSDIAALTARLDRLDANAGRAWTRETLKLIAGHPGRRAGDLADMAGRERLSFKADVRKLKALGLTESLEVGYRLSPRGVAYRSADDPAG